MTYLEKLELTYDYVGVKLTKENPRSSKNKTMHYYSPSGAQRQAGTSRQIASLPMGVGPLTV